MAGGTLTEQTGFKVDTVIVGLGVTGLSCARYLSGQGVDFAVTDSRENPPGLMDLKKEYPSVEIRCGGLDASLIMAARQCVVSPGVSIKHPYLEDAKNAGIEMIGDIELFARKTMAPVIAITGSNGKSTVTTLVYEMAKSCGLNVRVGGNLGTAALDLITETEPDLYVLELSSFQLESTFSLSPAVSVVLNVSRDHLDRYADIAGYAKAKERVYNGRGVMVLNSDDPIVTKMNRLDRKISRFTLGTPEENEFGLRIKADENSGQETTWLAFGEFDLMSVNEMKIKGKHNVANALAALALGYAVNLEFNGMLRALRRFPGLEHRCQWVANHNGVDWYNDSKGTNEGATCAAIEGLAQGQNIVLIAGGDAKGATFEDLTDVAKGRVKHAVLIGQDADRIKESLNALKIPTEGMSDMQEAVRAADRAAQTGDIVLLSPACASLDMFDNYMKRGQAFVSEVLKL